MMTLRLCVLLLKLPFQAVDEIHPLAFDGSNFIDVGKAKHVIGKIEIA